MAKEKPRGRGAKRQIDVAANADARTVHAEEDSRRPLSAVLSQILIAFTVELDNEFERRMSGAGYEGARVSLSGWSTVMRFLGDKGLSVQSLAEQSNAAVAPIKFALGCLERWRYVTVQPDESDQRLIPHALHKRAGRDLRLGWERIVGATPMGQKAIEIWPGLLAEIEQR